MFPQIIELLQLHAQSEVIENCLIYHFPNLTFFFQLAQQTGVDMN